jgi:hypothetical protein
VSTIGTALEQLTGIAMSFSMDLKWYAWLALAGRVPKDLARPVFMTEYSRTAEVADVC